MRSARAKERKKMLRRIPPGDYREDWMKEPGEMVWRRTFPGTKDQVRAARRFVEALFAETGKEDDAGLITDELVSNALVHSRSGEPGGWFGVEAALGEVCYVGVTDLGGSKRPKLGNGEIDPLSEGGRGLWIVEELALAVGIYGSPERGFTVWADLEPDLKTGVLAGAVCA